MGWGGAGGGGGEGFSSLARMASQINFHTFPAGEILGALHPVP